LFFTNLQLDIPTPTSFSVKLKQDSHIGNLRKPLNYRVWCVEKVKYGNLRGITGCICFVLSVWNIKH